METQLYPGIGELPQKTMEMGQLARPMGFSFLHKVGLENWLLSPFPKCGWNRPEGPRVDLKGPNMLKWWVCHILGKMYTFWIQGWQLGWDILGVLLGPFMWWYSLVLCTRTLRGGICHILRAGELVEISATLYKSTGLASLSHSLSLMPHLQPLTFVQNW